MINHAAVIGTNLNKPNAFMRPNKNILRVVKAEKQMQLMTIVARLTIPDITEFAR